MLDILVPQIMLDSPGVLPGLRQFVATGTPQHMRMNTEWQLGFSHCPTHDLADGIIGERCFLRKVLKLALRNQMLTQFTEVRAFPKRYFFQSPVCRGMRVQFAPEFADWTSANADGHARLCSINFERPLRSRQFEMTERDRPPLAGIEMFNVSKCRPLTKVQFLPRQNHIVFLPGATFGMCPTSRQVIPSILLPLIYRVTWQDITFLAAVSAFKC